MAVSRHEPQLTLFEAAGVRVWRDERLHADLGLLVAFTERVGGVSMPPFASLNLAAHVGDDPAAVDTNRLRLLAALGLERLRSRLTTGEQVHDISLELVTPDIAGAGAFAASGSPPLPHTDALLTREQDIPLMLCFADCVPVVLVAPGPAVAVVHAGWRGALGKLPSIASQALAREAGCGTSELLAYIGPHIGSCHYEVGDEIMSQFHGTFGTVSRASSGGLDLEAIVRRDLTDAGVLHWRITSLGACTAEETDRFFSYRAERGQTGRHAALACIASPS